MERGRRTDHGSCDVTAPLIKPRIIFIQDYQNYGRAKMKTQDVLR